MTGTSSDVAGRNAWWRAHENAFLEWLPLPHALGKLVLGVIVAGVVALLAVGALVALDGVLDSGAVGADVTWWIAFISFCGAASIVMATRFFEFWVPWRRDRRVFSDVYGSVMLAGASLTVAVVCLEVILGLNGLSNAAWVPPERGPVPTDPPLPTNDGLVPLSAEYFIWNFLDGIPVLKLTDSLNWQLERTFDDRWSGGLLVLYKLAVILPIVALIVRSLRAPEESAPAAPAAG